MPARTAHACLALLFEQIIANLTSFDDGDNGCGDDSEEWEDADDGSDGPPTYLLLGERLSGNSPSGRENKWERAEWAGAQLPACTKKSAVREIRT
jgi:hypothetical protein